MGDTLAHFFEVNGATALFVVTFACLCVGIIGEMFVPLRPSSDADRRRWIPVLGLWLTATAIVYLIVPIWGMGLAIYAQSQSIGLFHQLDIAWWVSGPAGFILLDLANYLLHRLYHAVPLLWRAHRVHHSDFSYDFSTALRFHPLETLLGLFVQSVVILAFGVPLVAVALSALIQNALNFWQHANLRRWPVSEARVGRLLVTPGVHEIHHSTDPRHYNRNFAGTLILWDRLFGTYVHPSPAAVPDIRFGVEGREDPRFHSFVGLLCDPFLSDVPAAASSGTGEQAAEKI